MNKLISNLLEMNEEFGVEESQLKPEDSRIFRIGGIKELKISNSKIRSMLNNHVLEVVFKRRIYPFKVKTVGHMKPFRRMLATSDWNYVNSEKSLYKFLPPSGVRKRSPAWYKKRNLIIVWDLIRKDWRMISLDEYKVVNAIPLTNKEEEEKFTKGYKNLWKEFGRKKLLRRFDR